MMDRPLEAPILSRPFALLIPSHSFTAKFALSIPLVSLTWLIAYGAFPVSETVGKLVQADFTVAKNSAEERATAEETK
jgi:hypothetical protein